MTEIVQQITAMLDRKRALESGTYMQQYAFSSDQQRWLIDAVRLLLEIELAKQK